MFKVAQSNSYKYPVSVDMISESGNTQKNSFTGVFRRLPSEEVTRWISQIHEANREGSVEAVEISCKVARELLVDWEDIRDADNEKIPFSADALNQILSIHPLPISIASAWLESVHGGTKRKN